MHVERLITCEQFVMNRWELGETPVNLPDDERFHLLVVIQGKIRIRVPGYKTTAEKNQENIDEIVLTKGQTVLLPSHCVADSISAFNVATVLDISLFEHSDTLPVSVPTKTPAVILPMRASAVSKTASEKRAA